MKKSKISKKSLMKDFQLFELTQKDLPQYKSASAFGAQIFNSIHNIKPSRGFPVTSSSSSLSNISN